MKVVLGQHVAGFEERGQVGGQSSRVDVGAADGTADRDVRRAAGGEHRVQSSRVVENELDVDIRVGVFELGELFVAEVISADHDVERRRARVTTGASAADEQGRRGDEYSRGESDLPLQ